MKYYPIFLDVKAKKCLVIGGGSVGSRKAAGLLRSGADVTVVSVESSNEVIDLAEKGEITLITREYVPTDLDGVFLVMGAVDDPEVGKMIKRDADSRNLLCNIADSPDDCNFILPSVVDRGDLVLAVSTTGKSPAFAKRMRKALEKEFGWEYSKFLRLMGGVRKKLLAQSHEPEEHKPIFEKLIDSGLLEHIKAGNFSEIDKILLSVVGKDVLVEDGSDEQGDPEDGDIFLMLMDNEI